MYNACMQKLFFKYFQVINQTHTFACRPLPPSRRPYAQCTPTDWQSAVGDIANWRLKIGVSRQVCTKRRPDRRH